MPPNHDSDEIQERDKYWQVKYKIRTIEDWRKAVNEDREKIETRLRGLEDYKLEMRTRFKDSLKWISIIAMILSAVISGLEHVLFK